MLASFLLVLAGGAIEIRYVVRLSVVVKLALLTYPLGHARPPRFVERGRGRCLPRPRCLEHGIQVQDLLEGSLENLVLQRGVCLGERLGVCVGLGVGSELELRSRGLVVAPPEEWGTGSRIPRLRIVRVDEIGARRVRVGRIAVGRLRRGKRRRWWSGQRWRSER